MFRLLHRLTARVSLFWRYLILLGTVAAMFLVTLSVSFQLFSSSLQTAYLDQAEESFQQNCQSFSKEVFSAYSIPAAVENSAAYNDAATAGSISDTQSIFAFNDVRDSFTRQCAMLRLPSESFLYFSTSQLCVFRGHMTQPAQSSFRSYLVYEDDTVLNALLNNDIPVLGLTLLPAQQVRINNNEPVRYMTLLVRSTSKREVYGFLYSEDSIHNYFHLNSLPDDTSLQLHSSEGQLLFSCGPEHPDDHRYIPLSSSIPSLNCTATIRIPRSYFTDTVRDSQLTIMAIFFVCIVAGLAMCLLFSHIRVKPFRDLIRDHAVGQTEDAPENELLAIDTLLKTTRQNNSTLREMLLSSLLVRSFSGQSIRQDEYQSLSLAFPQFQQPQRTAVVRDLRAGAAPEDDSSMFNQLRSKLPEQFLCEYIDLQEALILFPAEPDDFELFQSVLLSLNQNPDQPPRFVCGISAPFIGIGEIDSSIRQAQFCVPDDAERAVAAFSEDVVGTDLSSAASFDLKQFQQALATWNHRETHSMLDHLCAHPGPHPEDLFYSILFLLRSAAQAGKMTFASSEKTTYLQSGTPAANFAQLRDIADDLFQQKSALQLSDRQQLCEQIVQHIKDNFSDATFCLFALSKQFGVSERFAHNAIQSITGLNFSNFLALTRIQEAARLLRETDLSIQEVAEQCGYPAISTFYRNFKKHYLMTPADYKESIR